MRKVPFLTFDNFVALKVQIYLLRIKSTRLAVALGSCMIQFFGRGKSKEGDLALKR